MHLPLKVLSLSLSLCKSTAASGASCGGDTISFILKANSGLGLKRGGFACVFFKYTYFVCISKQNLVLSVVGINHWKACQLLLNSKAAKLALVKIFFLKRTHKSLYFEYFFIVLLLCQLSLYTSKFVLLSYCYYSQSKKVDPFCFSITVSVTARISSWYLSLEAAEMQRVLPIVLAPSHTTVILPG